MDQTIRETYRVDSTTVVQVTGVRNWLEIVNWCTEHFGVGEWDLNDSEPINPSVRWHMWNEISRITFHFRYPQDATLFRLRWVQ